AYGQEVTRDEAIIVAKNYFSSLDKNSKQVITFNSLNENRVNDITTWYVVNFLPEGWVIVSGRKETRPILAFSYTGSLS
ncbi:MAG TPA: Spi family protease inhibitor, partial [Bacteroidales bacterium]|nr:Spi family protease inhibitor [Bacteroidales bacterium]